MTGEPYHLRDVGLLESALAAPYNLRLYEGQKDILTLGIRLMAKIAQNHPFAQGNKRTGFGAGVAFIERNGLFVELPDTEKVADRFIDLTTGAMSEWDFRKYVRPFILGRTNSGKFW